MGQALGCRQQADRRHVLGAALEKQIDDVGLELDAEMDGK